MHTIVSCLLNSLQAYGRDVISLILQRKRLRFKILSYLSQVMQLVCGRGRSTTQNENAQNDPQIDLSPKLKLLSLMLFSLSDHKQLGRPPDLLVD